MNNKILARVVAVVLSVMMLGTVAFAAPVLNEDAAGFTDAAYDSSAFGTQKTMIAFTAASADATAPASANDILAIGQGSDLNPATVTFAAAKVPASGYVIVAYGGDNGTVVRTPLAVTSLPTGAEGAKVTATAKSIFAADGVTFVRNAIEVNATFPAAEATVTEVGYKANVAGSNKVNEIKKDIQTAIEGEGTISFNLLMVGVPASTTMEFVPYIKY